MIALRFRIAALALACSLALPGVAHAQIGAANYQKLALMIQERDFLGARVFTRRLAASKPTVQEWYRVRNLLFRSPEIGQDVILGWDRVKSAPGKPAWPSTASATLKKASDLLLAGDFENAIAYYQAAAKWLKSGHASSPSARGNVEYVYPYALHGLARALFSARRYAESYEVYGWIDTGYMRYRQVLFERMWAAFRMGRTDLALGAIASQKSAYFSEYLEPESYLLQIYLFKMLCRDDDAAKVMKEISEFRKMLADGRFGFQEWAKWDLETRIALRMMEQKALPSTEAGTPGSPVTREERIEEQGRIRSLLSKLFEFHRKRLIDGLASVEAYSQLAITPGIGAGLKPLEKIAGRAELLKTKREIWPAESSADSQEHWADEIGKNRYIGDSFCVKK